MKILITGGNSSVGICLKKSLLPNNEVYTSGRKDCDLIWDWNEDVENWTTPKKIEVLIHTAASFGGNDYESILTTESFNTESTIKLCELAKRKKVKHLILVSSISSNFKPTDPYFSIYSLSKKHSEELAILYCLKNDINLTILRPSQLYGESRSFAKHQPFLYNSIENSLKNKPIVIYGKNNPKRNYLFVSDFVEIISRVIDQSVYGAFDCLNPVNTSFKEIIESIGKSLNRNIELKFDSTKQDIHDNIFYCDNRLFELIQFEPIVQIEEGINRIVLNYES